MSAATPLQEPITSPRRTSQRVPQQRQSATRPRLVLVSQRRTPVGRLPFILLVGAVLVVGLVAVLILHMFAAQYAFRATALQQRLTSLTYQVQSQQQVVDADSSPTALQARAAALGMLPSSISGLHKQANGKVAGIATAIVPPPPVVATPKKAKSGKSGASTSKHAEGKHATDKASTKTGTTAKSATATGTATASKSGVATKTGTTKTGTHHHAHGGGTASP